MRFLRLACFSVAAVIGGATLTSFATAQTGARIFEATLMEQNQKAPEISTEELRRVLAEGKALVLDARPFMEYAVSHVPGAVNVSAKSGVPLSVYVSDVKEIERLVNGDRAKSLVLYCNGPHCGKSKRLSEELLGAGFTSVRRYQLGIPVWRALGEVTQIQVEGARYVYSGDRTAVFLDARDPEEFSAGSVRGARNVPARDVKAAKDDGRLPMEDHNTRIIVFGRDGRQARTLAEAVVKEAFHNVAFFDGSFAAFKAALP